MPKSRKHTHRYYRATVSYGKLWACALSDCTHYMPQHLEELMLNKDSICWGCGKRFQLDEDSLRMEKPECLSCRMGVSQDELLDKLAGL